VHVAGGRGLDDRGERKLIMWLCAGLVAHDAVARATEAVSSRWRAGGGEVAGRGAVAHLQIKTSPRAVRSGAMRERGAVLMTAAGSVVQCASDTAGPRALSMAPAHLPVAVIRACAESEQQGLAAARRLAPTRKVKASVAQAQPAENICIGRKHRCWW